MRKASKDMALVNRKTERFDTAVKAKLDHATLRDYGGRATVQMRWDLNEAAKRDMVFELRINNEKAYIDLEQLLSYTRLI